MITSVTGASSALLLMDENGQRMFTKSLDSVAPVGHEQRIWKTGIVLAGYGRGVVYHQ